MAAIEYFKLNSNISIVKFINTIGGRYQIKKVKSEKNSVSYLDTFDWRIYRSNSLLMYINNSLQLQKFENLQPSYKKEISNLQIFACDFPKSDLKNAISKIIQIRALQPVANSTENCTEYNILDSNAKIVLRLQINTINRVGKFVLLNALRGYQKELESFKSLTKSIVTETSQKEIFERILKTNNKIPTDYDPRMQVLLKPEMRSDESTKIILRNLNNTINRNIQGIVDDIDTEFLHDFRVASRRTRAALSQIKNVFESEISTKFNNQFTLFGKRTNKLRDLDVYLLNKDKYVSILPMNMKKNIEPFFSELQNLRNIEYKKVYQYLKSKIFQDQIQNWNTFLYTKSMNPSNAINANKPVITLVVSFIAKQFDKVVKAGNKITSESQDALYHKLRIQCKKLRYLLEFFCSLFPRDKINALVSHLKKLQDNLGFYNDLSVQQKTLKSYSQKNVFDTDVILALGYLIGKLNEEQTEVRKDFNNTYQEFSNKETTKIFVDLFAYNGGGK